MLLPLNMRVPAGLCLEEIKQKKPRFSGPVTGQMDPRYQKPSRVTAKSGHLTNYSFLGANIWQINMSVTKFLN